MGLFLFTKYYWILSHLKKEYITNDLIILLWSD